MKLSDEQIIKRIIKGNTEGYKVLFNRYSNKIYYLAYKHLNNMEDADDCVQEVFIRAFKFLNSFQASKSSFSNWIYHITINKINDIARIRNKRMSVEILDNVIVDNGSFDEHNENKILLTELEKYLGEIPYQVLLLKNGLNLKFSEIAEQIGWTECKTKHVYYKAYKKAREYYRLGVDEFEKKNK